MQHRNLAPRPLSHIETRRQRWLYQDLIPLGASTIVAGRGGIGKSTILAWLAASATRGTLPGDLNGEPIAVAFIAAEDDPATVLVPRLKAADADLDRAIDLSRVTVTGTRTGARSATERSAEVLARYADGDTLTLPAYESLPTIADDLAEIERALSASGARLLIVDPVISMMDGDQIKAADVRRNLDPLNALAQRLDIAIVLVMHFNKGNQNASDRVSGSHAFRDAARAVLLLAVDDETEQRILTMDKGNTTPRALSLAFDIDDAQVRTDDGDTASVGRARLIGETSTTVHQIVGRENDRTLGDLTQRILAFVSAASAPVTIADVAEALDEKAATVQRYLSRLVAARRLSRPERGKFASIGSDSHSDTHSQFAEVSSLSEVSETDPSIQTDQTHKTPRRIETHVSETKEASNAL